MQVPPNRESSDGVLPIEERRQHLLARWARQRRAKLPPTREAWTEDLRDLGSIHRHTAYQLTPNGDVGWPWIPPFEEEQLAELVGRALDLETRQILERAAKKAHLPVATQATDLSKSRDASFSAETQRDIQVDSTDASSDGPESRRAAHPEASRIDTIRWKYLPTWAHPTFVRILAGGACLGLIGALHFALWSQKVSTKATPEPPPPTEPPVLAMPPTQDLDRALAELNDVLALKQRPDLQAIYARRFHPFQTLGPHEFRRNPEIALGVVELSILRSERSWFGLVQEIPLLSAVTCGWLGDDPDPSCASHIPDRTVIDLAEWLETQE